MDNITVTIPLKDFEKLKTYEEVFYKNTYTITYGLYIGRSDFTRIQAVNFDEAIEILIEENRKLKQENNRLKDRKWYQILWNM